MIELICIKDYALFKAGEKCYAVGENSWTDDYENFEEYIFYGEYDYDFDYWQEIRIDKNYFMTPAEWRQHQMDSILNETKKN